MFTRMGGVELAVLVVTFPSTWRGRLSDLDVLIEAEAALRAAVQSWARDYLHGEIGGRTFWHPCGDKCGACGLESKGLARLGRCPRCKRQAHYNPHLNIIIPGMVATAGGELRRRRMFLGKHQLAALHLAIGAVLQEMAEVQGVPEPVTNIHWGYRDNHDKKLHALRYFGRHFPAWVDSLPHYGRDFGMLAGPGPKQVAYRQAIAGSLPADELKCPCCGDELRIHLVEPFNGEFVRRTVPDYEAATSRATGWG